MVRIIITCAEHSSYVTHAQQPHQLGEITLDAFQVLSHYQLDVKNNYLQA